MFKIKIVTIVLIVLPHICSSQMVTVGSEATQLSSQEQIMLVETGIQVEVLKYREVHYLNLFQQTTGGLTY